MPSNYPTGVDSFTTHHDDVNELIRAADINKIQDAVIAIETELGANPHGSNADVASRLATLLSAAVAAATYVPLTGSATIAGQKDFTTLPTFNGTPLGGALNERGTWATGTTYAVADVVNDTTNGQRYVCKAAHTSTTFASDLTGGKWTSTGPSKNYVDTAVAGTGQRLVETATKTANYTAVVKDLVPVDCTGGSVVITLPTGAAVGDSVAVRRADSSANTITVAAGGSDTIASGTGATTTTTITMQDSVQVYVYNGTGKWTVAGGHRSLAALDSRFLQQTTRAAANGVASLDGSTLVPTAQLATGTADNTKVLQGDRTWAAAVRLAQSGQVPAQEPVASGVVANVGTQATAARSDHIHASLGLFMMWGSGYDGNVAFDGTSTVTIQTPLGNSQVLAPSGGVYTIPDPIAARNITLANGVVLALGQGAIIWVQDTLSCPSGSAVIHADGINGLADGTGAAGRVVFGAPTTGTGGGGGTGVGSAPGPNLSVPTDQWAASGGGSGGAGAGGVGGTGGNPSFSLRNGARYFAKDPLSLFRGMIQGRDYQNAGTFGSLAGANGGAGGGGDGTNKGGGGGSGAGLLIVNARKVVGNIAFRARGGNGGTPTTGNCGGGGAGGGGFAFVNSTDLSGWTGAVTAPSGTPGAGVGTGTAGSAGGTGYGIATVWA